MTEQTEQTKEILLMTGEKISEEYSLKVIKANQIENAFNPTIARLHCLDRELIELDHLDGKITPEIIKKAGILKKKYAKLRTEGDAIHKEIKTDILLEGRAIDGARNQIKLYAKEREDQLEEVVNYEKKIKEAEIEAIHVYRVEILWNEFAYNNTAINFGGMDLEVWEAFYAGKKAEKKAVADARIETQKRKEREEEEYKNMLEERKKIEEIGKERLEILTLKGLLKHTPLSLNLLDLWGLKKEWFDQSVIEVEEAKKVRDEEDRKIKEEQDEKDRKYKLMTFRIAEMERAGLGIYSHSRDTPNYREISDEDFIAWKDFCQKKEIDKKAKYAQKIKEDCERAQKESDEKKAKEEAEQKKAEEEKLKQNEKYIDFLKKNGYHIEKVDTREIKIVKEGNTRYFYELKDKIVL